MKFAIATADGGTVCDHLARSSAFFVLEVEQGRVISRETRVRPQTACGRHATFVEMLAGCSAVICGGIGQGAADSLTSAGVAPVVTAGPHSLEEAAELYLSGRLQTTTERVCLCG
jgi:predicted Fe-Mo cluster-binding NifX family protein